jgi:hypothetical protein
LRHVHHLRIRRLNHINGLPCRLLHFNGLLRVGTERSRGIGLRTQPLNRVGHRALIRRKCLSNGGIIVDVLRHHLQNLRKIYQRNKGGIESLLLRGIGERGSCQSLVCCQPVVDIQNFLRIRRCRHDLRQQRIGIERNRREQLIELLRGERGVLSLKHRLKLLQESKHGQQQNRREPGGQSAGRGRSDYAKAGFRLHVRPLIRQAVISCIPYLRVSCATGHWQNLQVEVLLCPISPALCNAVPHGWRAQAFS